MDWLRKTYIKRSIISKGWNIVCSMIMN